MKTRLKFAYTSAVVGLSLFMSKGLKVFAEGTGTNVDSIGGYDAVTGQSTGGSNSGAVTNSVQGSVGNTVTNGSSNGGSAVNGVQGGGSSGVHGDPSTVGKFFKGYNPVTDKQMQTGAMYASPIINVFGYITGFAMSITIAWVAVQTAIDLLYWGVPPLRGLLVKQNHPAPSGGMGMGMGMGMGGQSQGHSSKLPVFVSDDMLQAMEQGGNVESQGGMNGGFGMGGGFGGGMHGGFGMGGGFGGQQQEVKRSHVLTTYFKKRLLSVVILGLCSAVLFSSSLLDTGINLGAFAVKIITMFNGVVSNNN